MLAYIKNTLIFKGDNFLVLGKDLGYKVFVKKGLLNKVKEGDTVELYLSHIKKEDKEELYGFESQEELDFFEELLLVPGVGPKHALSLLELDSVKNVKLAIKNADTEFLNSVPGIGKKTAKKIILELQDKINEKGKWAKLDKDLQETMAALGYKREDYISYLKEIEKDASLSEKVKKLLSLLSKT